MKRIVSLAVAIIMVAALFAVLPFAVSADEAPATKPEGTAVKTTEEFMAMVDGGTYYLDADIVLSESKAVFSGTLDGNGHAIVTTVPVFTTLGNATIKNLTVSGEVTSAADREWTAALAMAVAAASTVTLENVTNSANVSGKRVGGYFVSVNEGTTVDGAYKPTTLKFVGCKRTGTTSGEELVGGFVAYMYGDVLEMTDCTNSGAVTSNDYAGGFVARFGKDSTYSESRNATFTNCVNTAEVKGVTYVGGILAHARASYLKFDSCVNEGSVTATGSAAGGIAGNIGAKSKLVIADFVKCINKGEVTFDKINGDGAKNAGGIVGYVYGSGQNGNAKLDSCINLGVIKTGWFGSQFIGYCNSKYNVIKNSIAAGSIKPVSSETNVYGCVIGCSSADLTVCEIKNVFYVENDGTEYYSYATSNDNAANRVTFASYNDSFKGNITLFKAEDLASGKVAYELNKAAGETVVYQTLGTDATPVFDNTHGVVYLNKGAYSNTAPDPSDTETSDLPGGDDTTVPTPGGDDTTNQQPGGDDTTTGGDAVTTTETPSDTNKPGATTKAPEEGGCNGCGGFAAAAQVVALLVGVVGVALVVKRK